MNGKPHMLIGAAFGLGVSMFMPDHRAEIVGVAAFAATLPDLDQKWVNRSAPWPKPGAPCHLFEHRGPTHAVIAAVLLGIIGAAVAPWIGAALAGGYLSHLLADGLSYMGVPYLWPVIARRIRLLPYGYRLKSGTWIEWPIALSTIGGFVALTYLEGKLLWPITQ